VKQELPTRRMREHPNLEQLRLQAKQLFNAFKVDDSKALDEINAHYGSAQAAPFACTMRSW
jgi:hypothetical protein